MRFHGSVLLLVLPLVLECLLAATSPSIPSTTLEQSVKFKLRTASTLRDNVIKIFGQLKSDNFELLRSVETINRHLKFGGSFADSLHVLPALGYSGFDSQMNAILNIMEERSPRYLLPAVSVARKALSNLSDVQDGPQFNGINLLDGILAGDLPRLAIPTPFSKDVERHDAMSFVEKVALSVSKGFLNRSVPLAGLMAENLANFGHSPRLTECIERLKNDSDSDGSDFKVFKPDSDPYEAAKSLLLGVEKSSKVRASAEAILFYLKRNLKTGAKPPRMAGFFESQKANYSLLISSDKRLMRTKSGKALLYLILKNESLLKNGMDDFSPHEYAEPDDLLMAVVSRFRRQQALEGTISEVVESAYEELMRKSRHTDWKLAPRSGGAVKALLGGMRADQNSAKIRRLARDVTAGIELGVEPEAWVKIPGYVRDVNCFGPSCSALKVLEALQELNATKDPALNASIMELLREHREFYEEEIFHGCPDVLMKDLDDLKPTKLSKLKPNFEDLTQAIPRLDIESKEYKILRDFMASKDAEKIIGQDIDVDAHLTRGRLLAWLLGKIQKLRDVGEEVRSAARQFVDIISYEGYGAARVRLRGP